MALSDKITGQFRPKTQTQRPYLPTIVQDAAPARPPVAQPPPERTPLPPTLRASHTPTPTPMDEEAYYRNMAADLWRTRQSHDVTEQVRQARTQGWQPRPITTPTPPPDAAEQARQRAYEWAENEDTVGIIPPGFRFGRSVQKWQNLNPNVDWNGADVQYVEPTDNYVGYYNPTTREIGITVPDDNVLTHEYAHYYDDITAPGIGTRGKSSDPQFFGNWLAVSQMPWLFAEQHPTYDSDWYRRMANAVIRREPWGSYPTNPGELYAELATRYARSPYEVPAQLRPYIAGMFRDQPLPPPPNPYPRPVPTPRPLLAR